MCLVWISKGCTIQGQHRPKAGVLLPMKVPSTQHPTELAFFDIFWLFFASIVPKACHCQWRFHQLSIRLRRLCSSLEGVVGQLIQTTLNLLKYSGHPIDWVIRFISTRQLLAFNLWPKKFSIILSTTQQQSMPDHDGSLRPHFDEFYEFYKKQNDIRLQHVKSSFIF